MTISASDYEKLGQFYLGRGYEGATKQVTDDLILYDSKDLVTHGVVLGMTGSGKTGLCLALLEEAAMDNIPAIVIDPKGDISNLLLLFPELDAASFRPWINEDDAAKKGLSPDEHAAQTAAQWRTGLADWGQDPQRLATLREKVDLTIFTPGSKAGIPVSILSSLAVPPFEIMDDSELLGERIESTVSSLLSLVEIAVDGTQTPEAVLLAAIFQTAWAADQSLSLETLIRHIQKPAFDKVGVMDLESFLPEKSRQALALKFNNLLASPGFATWLEGTPLDIAKMLHTPAGKPRISIFSIAHLGDAERMFFVSLLLNQVLGWMRSQNGTTSLRALLYMDEIFGYLPPTANPPSKRPLMTLLKQGRAFGIGCLLATQNPVDLDYKALSNIGTWFLGRLQTERDKLRVLDGLEGAAGTQNAKFDRAEMERLLSGLGNRVFLMNNVHEDAPVLFHVRWAMCYLTGPLTRSQIKTLMDPKRAEFATATTAKAPAAAANPMAMPGMAAPAAAPAARPLVGSGVTEIFVAPAGGAADVTYQPHLFREGMVAFSSAKMGVDGARTVRLVNPITDSGIDWETEVPPPLKLEQAGGEPAAGAAFGTLPGFAMNAANYKQVEKDFAEWLYRNERAEVFSCPTLKEWSKFGETEADFRARLLHQAHEARDAAADKLRAAAAKKIATLEGRVQTATNQLAKEQAEATSSKMQAGASVLGGILGGLFGRKVGLGTISRGSAALGKATTAYKQSRDVANVEGKLAGLNEEIEAIQADLQAGIEQLAASFDPAALPLETESIKPAKTDVKVRQVALLWLPHDARGERAW
jgi:hypothetical protein